VIHGRKRTAVFAVFLTVLAGFGLRAAIPAQAEPSIDSVQKKVDSLYRQAEQASERANQAKDDLDASHAKLVGLDADLARQQAVVTTMRHQVATMVVEQYQGQSLSTASQVVLSNNPDAFLDNLNAVSSYNDQRGQAMTDFTTQLQRLTLRKQAVTDEVKQLDKAQQTLTKEKAQIDSKAAAAKAILDKLKASQLAEITSGTYSGPLPNVPASGRAAAAVRYAMAQVGKAYVWGAAGPSAFDCSGLMMAAWAQAGVGLPHSSSAQQGSGMRVSESQLQPGDLVFYYSPVSHVGMYIGNGLIVNAENPSVGVKVTGLHSMPYSGAVRPG
jgi:cell wall-associated NlpC family hydrolase